MSAYPDSRAPIVVVADDSRTIVAMVAAHLERSGYDVVATGNGEDALRLVSERRPALAILDVEMPNLDGYEVTRRLRADPATQGIPVILLTAHGDAAEIAAGYEAGATAYITKPFSPQELQARVESVLGRR